MYAVYDVGGVFCNAGKYCAFGTDAFGTDFCCNADPGNLNSVQLSGADYDDVLSFSYTSGGTTLELRDSPSRAIVGFQYGQAGDDQLFGSSSTRVNYDESLHGGDDADLLSGYDGGDSLYGDDGPDVCDGGAGTDYVDGGLGDDELLGGAQNDELAASGGNDELNGDIGADVLYGDLGDDLYCGGSDTVFDQLLEDPFVATDDRLWGAGAADYEQAALPGSPYGDGCSLNGTSDSNCDYTLSSLTCP